MDQALGNLEVTPQEPSVVRSSPSSSPSINESNSGVNDGSFLGSTMSEDEITTKSAELARKFETHVFSITATKDEYLKVILSKVQQIQQRRGIISPSGSSVSSAVVPPIANSHSHSHSHSQYTNGEQQKNITQLPTSIYNGSDDLANRSMTIDTQQHSSESQLVEQKLRSLSTLLPNMDRLIATALSHPNLTDSEELARLAQLRTVIKRHVEVFQSDHLRKNYSSIGGGILTLNNANMLLEQAQHYMNTIEKGISGSERSIITAVERIDNEKDATASLIKRRLSLTRNNGTEEDYRKKIRNFRLNLEEVENRLRDWVREKHNITLQEREIENERTKQSRLPIGAINLSHLALKVGNFPMPIICTEQLRNDLKTFINKEAELLEKGDFLISGIALDWQPLRIRVILEEHLPWGIAVRLSYGDELVEFGVDFPWNTLESKKMNLQYLSSHPSREDDEEVWERKAAVKMVKDICIGKLKLFGRCSLTMLMRLFILKYLSDPR